MDSGNSGSMQSSSGGSEEYDSRAESSISAFLNHNNPSTHIGHGHGSLNQPPPPPPQQHHSSTMFDPLSNYFDHPLSSRSPQLSTNPNSLLNLDVVWSKNLRSEPNCNDLGGGGFITAASSSPPTQQFQSRASSFPSMNQIPENNNKISSVSVSGGNSDQPNNNNMVRNPKKRSRASRRAPTTVLTTDTTNFRAMVQEFTGIPAPPFTSSPFPRTRLDLFGSSMRLSNTAAHLVDPSPPPPPPPHYLLRPFAQKLQPPFVSSDALTSSSINPSTTDNNNNNNITSSTSSTSINYQLPSQNLLNINMQQQNQNPVLNFQSLLQQKYPLSNSSVNHLLGTKPQGSLGLDVPTSTDQSGLKMGVLEEFGLSHVSTNLSGLQNMALPRNENSSNIPQGSSWGEGTGTGAAGQEHDQSLLRSINGGRVSNGKVSNLMITGNSSSDFHGDKAPENVAAARSEGMVESWICSSD
ncbi:VQ motif-containing protein [Corchorus capsularis]|uniref:VQ motif-containing protein n=1 Tax=Corchorus capsularis TaxID=210143 RepID=A0A1R3GDA0_COCAP|nr:VQ motif-containing protein [Corchorus capsularis]